MRIEAILTVSQMWVSLGCTTMQGSLKLPWPWHSQCLHFSGSVPLSKRRSKRRHIPGNFLILLCTSYFSVIKEKQKWISGQNSICKFVLKYWQYVLLSYTWYLASEIFLTSPSSLKFDKVLQVVSPKALPHFSYKGPRCMGRDSGKYPDIGFWHMRQRAELILSLTLWSFSISVPDVSPHAAPALLKQMLLVGCGCRAAPWCDP